MSDNKIYPVPEFKKEFLAQTDNIKLAYDKFIPFLTKINGRLVTVRDKEINQELKKEVFGKVKSIRKDYINKLLSSLDERFSKIATTITLKTQSRMVIGLGSGSVLENSLRLHHIYGFPYIPSTTIKGVLRAYNVLKIINFDLSKYEQKEWEIENIKELKGNSPEEMIVRIFGNQQLKGQVIFFDALPKKLPEFEEDITNVHYPEYYRNGKPPADNQSPNPIKFLTLKAGTEFNFYYIDESKIYSTIKEDIIKASKIIGFGAKTSIGYGIFE